MFKDLGHWYPTSQRNPVVVDLFSRHYSSKKNNANKRDWLNFGILGPGESLTLINSSGTALFAWRRQSYRMDGYRGVECSVFRNESQTQSSDLIKEAVSLALGKWPDEQFFTFVNPLLVKSTNPGYCFKAAGWENAGVSARGLVVLAYYVPNHIIVQCAAESALT